MKKAFFVCLSVYLIPTLSSAQDNLGLLRIDPDQLTSKTQTAVWGGVEEGRFKPLSSAVFQWSAGAEAKTVRHGKKTSWTGALSFEQMMGQHMYSSMFLEPTYYPMDILEPLQGNKSRQTARLEGGFLTEFGYEWAAGLRASAKGGYISKSKNVRHSSFGIDAEVAPTITYIMDDQMGLVSSGLFRYRMESLQASGEVDELFLNKGMMYGERNALGSGAFPVTEFAYGFDELLYSPEVSAGFSIVWKRGQAGRQFKYPGSTLKAFIQHTILADAVDHTYGISYQRQRDQLREKGSEGKEVSCSDRRGRNLGLKYEARFLHGVLKSVGVNLDGNQWRERYIPASDLAQWYDATANLSTTFAFGPVDLDIDVLAGRGWWNQRGLAGEDSPSQAGRLTDEWNKRMEYALAPRVGVGGAITVRIPAVKGLFVQLSGSWCRGFDIRYLPGKNREIGQLKIGYDF